MKYIYQLDDGSTFSSYNKAHTELSNRTGQDPEQLLVIKGQVATTNDKNKCIKNTYKVNEEYFNIFKRLVN